MYTTSFESTWCKKYLTDGRHVDVSDSYRMLLGDGHSRTASERVRASSARQREESSVLHPPRVTTVQILTPDRHTRMGIAMRRAAADRRLRHILLRDTLHDAQDHVAVP